MKKIKEIIFRIKKTPVIIISGEGRKCTAEAIKTMLRPYFSIGKDVIIFEKDFQEKEDVEKAKFLILHSKKPILIGTHVGEIPPERLFFAGERRKVSGFEELVKILPSKGEIILNFDDETVRELENKTVQRNFSFGFQERSDLKATDINITREGTNFKVNFEENTVPFWLNRIFGKEQIYSALAGILTGELLGLNLVEMSQSLKNYRSLPGKMRLISGRYMSEILDDSENATVPSMIEALKILKSFKGKKIAVLGDILGIGKYTIEAHQSIGETVAKSCDVLITVGPRAKFIAEGAKAHNIEEVISFDRVEDAAKNIREFVKERNIVLVDGSKEINMGLIVKEIKEGAN